MERRSVLKAVGAGAMVQAMAVLGADAQAGTNAEAGTAASPVYELRTYHAAEGKLPELIARFHDHTDRIFRKHGMKAIAYWTPTDDPLKGKTFVYILRFPSRQAATERWQAFKDDSEWQKVQANSEAAGKLVDSIDSTFLELTDFSPKI